MKTTAGLLGEPVDSAQIFVPSAEVTLTPIANETRGTKARREGRKLNMFTETLKIFGRL